ncbi:pilus assembly protein TadG-related protein [Pelagovum sp. HNIBRBA483]|uniref:pilus assembly protein TadG-related protein n=1 Tax=Pelagovum sp. HNIBRBA483 TaxID=3233341 RepID=UPI0034A429CC
MIARQAFQHLIRRLATREDGGITIFGLFMCACVLILGGIAVDISHLYAARTQLQVTTDVAAHAALHSVNFSTRDPVQAKIDALATVEANMPKSRYGEVITAQDITFGNYDYDTRTFTPDATSDDAVAVRGRRARAARNPVSTFLLRLVGIDYFDAVTQSVFVTYIPSCFREGFVANNTIDMQSNNIYTAGFCIHSNSHVELNSSNEFADNTVVSMPNDADIVTPGGELDSNPGLEGALDEHAYKIGVLKMLPVWMADFAAGNTNFTPDYINASGVISLTAPQFKAPNIKKNRIHLVTCNGSQPLNFSSNVVIEDLVLITNCQIHFAADALLRNSVIATTNTASKSIYAGANITIGEDDNCGAGGDSQILTLGSVELTAGVNIYGSQIIAQDDIYLTSNAVGIEGASLIAGDQISITSNGSMGFCGGESMTRNFEVDYFRLAY